MNRPKEHDYTSHVAYARALEYYCDRLEQSQLITPPPSTPMWNIPMDQTKREWVGLTDAELKAIAGSDQLAPLCIAVATTVEVTLKQKNSYDTSIP